MSPSTLSRLIARAAKPVFRCNDDIREVARGMIELSVHYSAAEIKTLMPSLRKFCRRDPKLVISAIDYTEINVNETCDGRRLAVVLRSMPATYISEQFWNDVLEVSTRSLRAKVWKIEDCQWVATSVAKHGGYDTNFIKALADYLKDYVEKGELGDLTRVFMIISAVTPLKNSELLQQACNKAAATEGWSASAIGQICYCLNRIQYVHHNLAISIQEEADRIAECSELFATVNVFYFIARHDAQHISAESLQWLAESLLTGVMDRETLITVCTALGVLPKQIRQLMRQEIVEILIHLSGQVQELLQLSVEEGGIKGEKSMELIQVFVSKFFQLRKVLPVSEDNETEYALPSEYISATEKCAILVDNHVETLVSDENPPYSLVPHLLDAPSKHVQQTGLSLLREMAQQSLHIPSLQTFRFVLLLGDHRLADPLVFKYLRNQFAKTSTDIPIVQLCTALKCFAPGLAAPVAAHPQNVEEEVEQELEEEQSQAFFRYIKETLLKNIALGVDFRCIMAVIDTLLQLACSDVDFFKTLFSYVKDKMKSVTPADQSADAAQSILDRISDKVLAEHEGVREFLETIVREGRRDEKSLTPSQWMDLHDPAHALLPLTEEQKEGWKIIDTMVITRADDRTTLIELAKKYIDLLPVLRPDDSKFFFGVFEEKVLKEDILLKDCLEQLISTGIVTKLSATTIAAILHSLAVVRFVYSRTVKAFLSAISAEQWSTMDATPLVHLLGGLSKLSMRIPVILNSIGSRIHEVHRFMSPFEVAQCIHSLQALGFKDDSILMELMQHASSSARSFDDASLALLFTAPSVHRLLRKPEIALPLLQRATRVSLSIRAKEKVVRCISKAPLPRELINTATSNLLSLESPKEALRLT